MKTQHIIISLLILALSYSLHAQSSATTKNTVWLSVSANTSIAIGDLYYKEGNIATFIGVSPSYFFTDHLFAGGHAIALFTQEQDEWQIGPQIGYSFNFTDSKHFPYIIASVSYTNGKQKVRGFREFEFNGITTKAGIGYALNLGKYLLMNIECGFQHDKLQFDDDNQVSDISINSSGFYTGIGFTAILFSK